mgnify:CR=1 FL=1
MKPTKEDLVLAASTIRCLSADGVQKANSGHPGAPMGMADIAEVLWNGHLKHNPADPEWADRDRFVLSNGHGSMLIYSLLHLTGYEDMTLEQIKNFRQWGARTAGHPEFGHMPGVETTTGPLGQGIAGTVAETGETLRLEDAYEDARFDRSWDEASGYRTRQMLCKPIRNREGRIAGVFQLLNKREGAFDEADEVGVGVDGRAGGGGAEAMV